MILCFIPFARGCGSSIDTKKGILNPLEDIETKSVWSIGAKYLLAAPPTRELVQQFPSSLNYELVKLEPRPY